VLLLSIYLPSFKTLGAVDLHRDPLGGLQTLLLPAFVLSLASATTIMRYTRVAMLEVLAEPYMATARAKGAGRLRVLIRHGLRNALLPVVTAVGVTAAHLIAGAVVVEQVFGLPGIGQLMLNAIYHRDYTQVQATVLVITTLVVLINIMVDLSYYLLDPRIQQHG
jgi:peptide/nickel transport system permease protein